MGDCARVAIEQDIVRIHTLDDECGDNGIGDVFAASEVTADGTTTVGSFLSDFSEQVAGSEMEQGEMLGQESGLRSFTGLGWAHDEEVSGHACR